MNNAIGSTKICSNSFGEVKGTKIGDHLECTQPINFGVVIFVTSCYEGFEWYNVLNAENTKLVSIDQFPGLEQKHQEERHFAHTPGAMCIYFL